MPDCLITALHAGACAGKQGGAAEALAVVTAAAQESGVISRGEQVVEDLLAQASPVSGLGVVPGGSE